jgi:hypothetical protein
MTSSRSSGLDLRFCSSSNAAVWVSAIGVPAFMTEAGLAIAREESGDGDDASASLAGAGALCAGAPLQGSPDEPLCGQVLGAPDQLA